MVLRESSGRPTFGSEALLTTITIAAINDRMQQARRAAHLMLERQAVSLRVPRTRS